MIAHPVKKAGSSPILTYMNMYVDPVLCTLMVSSAKQAASTYISKPAIRNDRTIPGPKINQKLIVNMSLYFGSEKNTWPT